MSAYIVCDSIHQLSHGGPTFKTDTDISEFVGIDRSHVGHIRKLLLSKGLVTEIAGGWETTDLWKDALLHVPGKFPTKRGKTPENGEIPHHTINKEVKNITSNSEELQITKEIPTEVKKKTDLTYRGVFALWENPPRNWLTNKTQIQAAKNLLEEQTLPGIILALEFVDAHVDDPFCPTITSPYDLDSKWAKLLAYKNKLS